MRALSVVALLLTAAGVAAAQNHEIGLTLGRLSGPTRSSSSGSIALTGGTALQANYGYRVLLRRHFSLSPEVHFLANGLREISARDSGVTRDVATLYITPGLRVKFALPAKVTPYAVVGGGYALYEQSHFTLSDAPNPAPRFTHRGTLTFGGGVDAPLWRWIGLRLEVRDFYSGNPSFNATGLSGGQHNVVVGGGFLLKFGSRE
jgi:hypothetical protein